MMALPLALMTPARPTSDPLRRRRSQWRVPSGGTRGTPWRLAVPTRDYPVDRRDPWDRRQCRFRGCRGGLEVFTGPSPGTTLVLEIAHRSRQLLTGRLLRERSLWQPLGTI